MNPQKISKIATITILFWFLKIVATTLGETLGDYISMTLNLGYLTGIAITAVLFLAFVYKQVRSKKYHPISFWLVIIATTTLGTEISDFIDRSLHLGYTLGSLLLFAGLGITLLIWHRKYKSIEVAAITESNKEILFWITVLFSNSLGTAFGDYLSDVVGFSYLQGAMVTSAIILLVVALHYLTKIIFLVSAKLPAPPVAEASTAPSHMFWKPQQLTLVTTPPRIGLGRMVIGSVMEAVHPYWLVIVTV